MPRKWITPFTKQCYVTLGVSLNMTSHGMVMGFAAILLPQLREHSSPIQIDDTSGSWIASIVGFALVAGNFVVPIIMATYGRKTANIASIVPMLIGWFCIIFAPNVPTLLVARSLQGFAMGFSTSLCPTLIGEYTSPKNRGAFLTTISLAIATGVLIVHTMGLFLCWQTAALVCAVIAFVDLLIVIYSPESPSWMADQGRYEDSKKTFRWLRGDVEEDELHEMIANSIIVREAKVDANLSDTILKRMKINLAFLSTTMKKKEFYKPIFIMVHIYTLAQWGGSNIFSAYALDTFENVIGENADLRVLVITLDVQRIISNICAVYVIKKIRRRSMLFGTVGINLFAFLATAAYTYCKSHDMLPFDHPAIGVALIHIHMFSVATGTVPLPFIIAGELFPLEYRSLSGSVSVLFLAFNLFLCLKTLPHLYKNIGLYGAYCIYAAVVGYCLVIAGIFLPETKDRTLQEIEDEFRGKSLTPEEVKYTQSLTSLNHYNRDRRCSSIII